MSKRCEFSRTGKCPNKPWRQIEVSWHGRPIASYWFCRKHFQTITNDGKQVAT